MEREYNLKKFIEESIKVIYAQEPLMQKKPDCPSGFLWRNREYQILELLSEWHDYHRKGKMSRNMQPRHAALAETRGSWGVGQFYFRVRVDTGEIFDIYFDRAPKDVNNKKGSWHIYRELELRD